MTQGDVRTELNVQPLREKRTHVGANDSARLNWIPAHCNTTPSQCYPNASHSFFWIFCDWPTLRNPIGTPIMISG
jgi:hypothetical protein